MITSHLPSGNTMKLRLYRTPSDGDSIVFFATIDSQAPIVAGVTIVGRTADLAPVLVVANEAGLYALALRWPDGRRAIKLLERLTPGRWLPLSRCCPSTRSTGSPTSRQQSSGNVPHCQPMPFRLRAAPRYAKPPHLRPAAPEREGKG